MCAWGRAARLSILLNGVKTRAYPCLVVIVLGVPDECKNACCLILAADLTPLCTTSCREYASGSSSKGRRVPRWDGRTRAAIAAVMRHSEQAQALLGEGVMDAAADARDERLAQLRGLLG